MTTKPEPVFVNINGAQESIPPFFAAWKAGTTNRVGGVPSRPGINFWAPLKLYK